MKRVLVTGAGGFIGRQCLDILAGRGFEVHAVDLQTEKMGDAPLFSPSSDSLQPKARVRGENRGASPIFSADNELRVGRNRGASPIFSSPVFPPISWHAADLLDDANIARLLADVKPTHLLHLAWYAEPGEYWASPKNLHWVRASLALIEQFVACGGVRAVMAGTCAEYDWSEGMCVENETPLAPQTLYGACKHALHIAASAYARQVGLSLAWGRVFFLYGPGEKPQRLVPSIIRSLLRGERAACKHGQFRRDYIHVRDAAAALAATLDSPVTGPVNIATGQPIALGDLVARIGRTLDREDLVDIIETPGEPELIAASVARLRDEVGFVPATDIATGLDQTIQWWTQQPDADPAEQTE